MNWICEKEITALEAANENFMPKIEINKNSTRKLIEEIGIRGYDGEALNVLNLLGQNIEKINTLDYSYTHLGKKLQFSELSRGEQVFLISYAAKISNISIFLQYDMMQLTKTSLRKYYKEFDKCTCINIIYSTQSEYNYLRLAMQGEI